MDLFSSAAQERLRHEGPLAARMRPRRIEDVLGQDHLLGKGMPLRRMVDADDLHSLILWGPPGTGKTSITLAIAGSLSAEFEQLSAVSAGVKDVRQVIENARTRLGVEGRRTILFIDEIHRFSKTQQDALLPAVEEGLVRLIGATTENPYFQVNGALLSRSILFEVRPLDDAALRLLVERAGLLLDIDITTDAVEEVIRRCGGDARQALTILELVSVLASGRTIGIEDVELGLSSTALRYSIDEHYDVISAFIKSMRGGDPQASLVYLTRMLLAGEDPRFIARRMVIFASEDVGLADPRALSVAVDTARAIEFVGLPEGRYNLAQCAVYMSLAPKSRSIADAVSSVDADVSGASVLRVPVHLRDSHSPRPAPGEPQSVDRRDGEGSFLPDEFVGRSWYRPTDVGFEEHLRTRMVESSVDSESTDGRRGSEET